MKFTANELRKRGYVKNADGSWSRPSILSVKASPQRLPDPEPQRDAGGPLVDAPENEIAREERLVVRITGRRSQLLDPDNFAGGCKYLIDQLRYAGIIPEDNPGAIELVTRQERVTEAGDEGTVVEITKPNGPEVPA